MLLSPCLRLAGFRYLNNLSLQAAIESETTAVGPPSPFVEIAYHVGEVDAKHLQALARCSCMLVDNTDPGPIHGGPPLMNAPGDVDVFRIHEETFVEESAVEQGLVAEKKETAKQVGAVERKVMVMTRDR